MTGVEEVILDIVLTRDQMRTGCWQQLGFAGLGSIRQVDKLDPVAEGRHQDVLQHPVLHWQLLEHERGPRLLTEGVNEQDYPEND